MCSSDLSFDRPNLLYRVLRRGQLKAQLQQILARHEDEAGIIYCPSRREVESLAEWLRGPLRAWADERLTTERLQATGWLDPAPIRTVWQEHLSRRANHDYRLWTILVLVEFLSRWDTR